MQKIRRHKDFKKRSPPPPPKKKKLNLARKLQIEIFPQKISQF